MKIYIVLQHINGHQLVSGLVLSKYSTWFQGDFQQKKLPAKNLVFESEGREKELS